MKTFSAKPDEVRRDWFVVDAKGVLVNEWRGVKVVGHADAVLEFVRTL